MTGFGGVGGIGPEKKADDQVRDYVAKVKQDLETRLGRNYRIFQAISYKSQLVNGTNYFVKVKTDEGYQHLRIYVPFDLKNIKLVSVQQGKSKEEEISYF